MPGGREREEGVIRVWLLILALAGALLGGVQGAALASVQRDDAVESAKAAVLRAHDESIYRQAYLARDAALLAQGWGGEALLDMQDDLARLRALGQYLDLQLESLEFLEALPLSPRRVRVVTREQWLVRVYLDSGQLLGQQRQIVDNRYVVQQDDDGWRIVEVDQEVKGGDVSLRSAASRDAAVAARGGAPARTSAAAGQ